MNANHHPEPENRDNYINEEEKDDKNDYDYSSKWTKGIDTDRISLDTGYPDSEDYRRAKTRLEHERDRPYKEERSMDDSFDSAINELHIGRQVSKIVKFLFIDMLKE